MGLSSEEEPLSHQTREGLENKLRTIVTNLTQLKMCQFNPAGHKTASLHNGSVLGGRMKIVMIRVKLGKVGKVWVAAVVGHSNVEFRKRPRKATLLKRLRESGVRPALNEEVYVESVTFS